MCVNLSVRVRFGIWPTDCWRAAGHSTTFTFDLTFLANIACNRTQHAIPKQIPIQTYTHKNILALYLSLSVSLMQNHPVRHSGRPHTCMPQL